MPVDNVLVNHIAHNAALKLDTLADSVYRLFGQCRLYHDLCGLKAELNSLSEHIEKNGYE